MSFHYMNYLALVEICGARELSKQIAFRCGELGVDEAFGLRVLRHKMRVLIELSKSIAQFDTIEWGSDSTILRFSTLEEALAVSKNILQRGHMDLISGSSLLKPYIGITRGQLRMDGDKPVDDDSISLHEASEESPKLPFSLLLSESVVEEAQPLLDEDAYPLLPARERPEIDTRKGKFYRFQLSQSAVGHSTNLFHKQILRYGLKPFEGVISEDDRKSFDVVGSVEDQAEASIRVIGGGPPPRRSTFQRYIQSELNVLSKKSESSSFTFQRIAFLYESEPERSYFWLRFNARLLDMFPGPYEFRYLNIPRGCPKPVGFRIIDSSICVVSLRSYNTEVSTATTSKAVMFDSHEVASAFSNVFAEYWREAISADPAALYAKADELKVGLRQHEKDGADRFFDSIFSLD